MHLPKPFAPLLYSLGIPVIPAHILEPVWKAGNFNHTWGIDTPPEQLVGDGAYKMMHYAQSQVVNYDRNNNYWMKDEHGGQLPRLHGQTVTIVQDQNAEYLRYLSGQIDVYSRVPRKFLRSRRSGTIRNSTSRFRKWASTRASLFFSFNRNPRHFVKNGVINPKLNWFTDLKFLQAMAHMIDKKSMIDLVFHGLAVPAVADISPENKIFANPNLKDYDYDPKLAADMLEAAGYHLVKPGVRTDPKGNRLEFDLTTNTGNPERNQMCTIFKQDLESLGIKVNYRPLEFTTLVDKLDSSFDWDCMLMGFTGGIEPNDGAELLSLIGQSSHLESESAQARHAVGSRDRHAARPGRVRDGYHQAPSILLENSANPPRPVADTRDSAPASAMRRGKTRCKNYQPTVWGPSRTYKPEWMEFKAD